MKISIDKMLLQDYCDIASFIHEVSMIHFLCELEKENRMANILIDKVNYSKEYNKVYKKICKAEVIKIAAFKFSYYNIAIFGDYTNDEVIVIKEDDIDDTYSSFGIFKTDYIIDTLTELRKASRDEIIL